MKSCREVALKQIQDRHAETRKAAPVSPGSRGTAAWSIPASCPSTAWAATPTAVLSMACASSRATAEGRIERYHKTNGKSSDPGERAAGVSQLLGRFVDVCNAIGYAHSRGVLHRRPEAGHILLGPYGETLVVDWGWPRSWPIEAPVSSDRSHPASRSSQRLRAHDRGSAIGHGPNS